MKKLLYKMQYEALNLAQEVKLKITQLRAEALKDDGMATAEYAIVMVAAAGFAGLLVIILRSDEIRSMLLGIIEKAFQSNTNG